MSPWSPRAQPFGVSGVEAWDASSPLVLREVPDAPSSTIRFGIGGNPMELYQNLYACLRVGRMDRATAILQRLAALYNPSAIEVVEAHNAYLQTLSEIAQLNPEPDSMDTIEEWFDANMIRKAIQPNANTFITLLRAAMSLFEGETQQATLQKYIALAQECCGPDVLNIINSSEEFDENEWNELIRAQPERFKEPPQVEENLFSTPAGKATLIKHGIIANPAHTVRSVDQKGQGLISLKNSLSAFDDPTRVPYPHDMEGSKEDKDRAYAYMRQLQIERDATDAAVARWKIEDEKLQEMGIHGTLMSKPVQALMWQWHSALLPRIKKEQAKTKEVLTSPGPDNQNDPRHHYGPYLELCKPEKLAAITITRVIQSIARNERETTTGLKVTNLAMSIGEAIRAEAHTDAVHKYVGQRKKERRLARRAMLDSLSLQQQPNINADPLLNNTSTSGSLEPHLRKDIPTTIKLRLGSMLLEQFLQSAFITLTIEDPKSGKRLTSNQAAFHHHVGFSNGKRTGWIMAHQEILSKLVRDSTHSIQSSKLPMVFEPKPWTDFEEGGYYTSPTSVIRTKNADHSQRAYAQSAVDNGDLDKILAGLDVLGKVPWQINKDVFEVMVEAWNKGEGIGAMVANHDDLTKPEMPADNASASEKREWGRLMKEYENQRSGFHSQRCFQNFQLELARAYVNEEKMYFPHSVDFRGRAYPIPPILNHIGSDFARCLLKFANGKELGSVGLHWLKVHLANLYGFDKASLHDREQFAMDNMQNVYDSATNPLSGKRWWTKAEDPWQCLACCIELRNALESPDPTRFISHLPVHQDGTCNGLQHYAALGGDLAGASQVNLEPSDKPQDIYTGVADLVKSSVAEDAANGNELAILLKDKITRKVVKRTVMTNVYGVTFVGARLQVEGELKPILPGVENTKIWSAASYIALKIFQALGQIFNGAQDIQHWLGECGDRITTSLSAEQIKKICEHLDGKQLGPDPRYKTPKKLSATQAKKILEDVEAFKTSIIWTTPLKMPVVQPYRKEGTEVIKTHLQDIRITRRGRHTAVDRRKQLQAFPPNFIHSLDASHMMLSALKCSEVGLDFAAVHDSFWTHAADIPNLNTILRDAFVRMHSEDIIGRLAAEFEARYAGHMFRASIDKKSVAGRKIAAWRIGNSSGSIALAKEVSRGDAPLSEIALEVKRQELLNSEEPLLQAAGRAMVTPTSIWLDNQDPEAFAATPLKNLLGDTKEAAKVDGTKKTALPAEAETTTESMEGLVEIDTADLDVVEESLKEDTTADKHGKMKTVKKSRGDSVLTVWLPLTFPPVPKKGDWDVSRLRESEYFFS